MHTHEPSPSSRPAACLSQPPTPCRPTTHLGSAAAGTATIFDTYSTSGASAAVSQRRTAPSTASRLAASFAPPSSAAAALSCSGRGGSRRAYRSGAAARGEGRCSAAMLSTASDSGSQALQVGAGGSRGQGLETPHAHTACMLVCSTSSSGQPEPARQRHGSAHQSRGWQAHRSTERSAARASGCCSTRGVMPLRARPCTRVWGSAKFERGSVRRQVQMSQLHGQLEAASVWQGRRIQS